MAVEFAVFLPRTKGFNVLLHVECHYVPRSGRAPPCIF